MSEMPVGFLRIRRTDSAFRGGPPGQIRLDVLIDLLRDRTAPAEMQGISSCPGQGEILRMGLVESGGQIERVGETVGAGRSRRRRGPAAVEIQILVRIDDRLPVFSFEILSVPESGIHPLVEIRSFDDVDFRQFQCFLFRHDGPEFAGEIEPHSGETFQKIIHGEYRSAFMHHAPDAAGPDQFFRIGLRVVAPREADVAAPAPDEEAVAGQIFPFQAFFPGGFPESDVKIDSFSRPGRDGNLLPEDLRKNFLQFLRGETGDLGSRRFHHDDGFVAGDCQIGVFADFDFSGQFGAERGETTQQRQQQQTADKHCDHSMIFGLLSGLEAVKLRL